MSRNAVLLRAATGALLLFTAIVLIKPHVDAWAERRECDASGGRWIGELRACAMVLDASDQAAT